MEHGTIFRLIIDMLAGVGALAISILSLWVSGQIVIG